MLSGERVFISRNVSNATGAHRSPVRLFRRTAVKSTLALYFVRCVWRAEGAAVP